MAGEIRIQLGPEYRPLRVLGLGNVATTAFFPFGVDNLAELVQSIKQIPVYFRATLSRANDLAAVLTGC